MIKFIVKVEKTINNPAILMYLIHCFLFFCDPFIIKKMNSTPITIPQVIHKLLCYVNKDLIKNMVNINIAKEMQYCIVLLLLYNILN